MNMSTCNPNSMKKGHSNPITTPCDGGSSIGGFVNDVRHHLMMLEPNKKKMDALHDNQKNKVICGLSQKAMFVHPSQASSSKSSSPSPFSLFNDYELMVMSEWDTNQKVKVKNDTNIANDNIIKGQWTPQEDSALVELVNQLGPKKWSQIARLLQGRIGKQCRERWNNHLQPNIRKESWSLEEDMILIKAHQEFGTKWSKIAKRLSGRTENGIKNHWNATMRRQNCNKNSHAHYKGTMLHAYVKWVAATVESAKVLKKSSNRKNKKVLRCNCDELALLLS